MRTEGFMSSISGYRIVESLYLVKPIQVRFPRSKKKRMRKKWAKNPRNFTNKPSNEFLVSGDMIVGHPALVAELRRQMKDRSQSLVDKLIRGE